MLPQLNIVFHNRLLEDEVAALMTEAMSLELDDRIIRGLLRFFTFVEESMNGIHGTNSVVSMSFTDGVLYVQFVVASPMTNQVLLLAELCCGSSDSYDRATGGFVERQFKDVYRTVNPLSTSSVAALPYESLRNALYSYMEDLSKNDIYTFLISSTSNYMHLNSSVNGELKVTRMYPHSDTEIDFNIVIQSIVETEIDKGDDHSQGLTPYLMQAIHDSRGALMN